ncbi:hypothetical protein ERJ77_22575, partial [Vibrio anguillarum]|nr:hypothetical protein [Vibrio anguillarum]
MKAIWSTLALVSIIVMYAIAGILNHYIEQTPERHAVTISTDNDSHQKVKTFATAPIMALTDKKLLQWTENVIATCFSLTQTNIQSKSDYCQERYFVYSAGRAYKSNYVSAVEKNLAANTANQYAAMPYPPIIIQSPKPRHLYYVVYVQTLVSI